MTGWRFSVSVGLAVLSLVLRCETLAGQSTFGMIQGRVTDSTGAVLPGTTVMGAIGPRHASQPVVQRDLAVAAGTGPMA